MTDKGVVFFPDRHLVATPREYRLEPYEDVFFQAEDGTRLHGWFINGADESAVLLWLHGNAENISHCLDSVGRLIHTLHISVFLFDYREYGLSEGYISKLGTICDARGAYAYLARKRGFKGSSIMLFGRSLGTAPAVDVAAREECLGVVLEAAFTSSDDMMQLYFPLMPNQDTQAYKFDSLSLIDRVRSPILFIHGEFDHTIPISMSRRLYDRARAPKYFYEVRGADHNNTDIVGGSGYIEVWQNFMRNCVDNRL